MFPQNKIGITYMVKVGHNNIDGDIYEPSAVEVVSGVILAPESTTDRSEPHQLHDSSFVQLHLPKSFTKSVKNSTFVALDGPFKDRIFKIQGDPVPYAYSPLKWNRQVRAEEIYR